MVCCVPPNMVCCVACKGQPPNMVCCVVYKGSLLTWCVDKTAIYCQIRSGTPILSHVSSCVSKYKNISVGIMLNSRALFWVENCVFFREPWETVVSHGSLLHGCFNSFTSDVNVLGSSLTETWFIISLLNILDPPTHFYLCNFHNLPLIEMTKYDKLCD